MEEILKELNEKQRQAVRTVEGPILILAGAGSGKTKALTHRVAYLVKVQKIRAENILAVTFTNKAASEMASRVLALIGENPLEVKGISLDRSGLPMLGTFHSVCAKILRRDGYLLGYKKSFSIFDEDDSLKIIKEIVKDLALDDKRISLSGIKNYISGAKNELITPEEYGKNAVGYFQKIVAEIYPKYQTELLRNNALDFDDLINQVVRLFQTNKAILSAYQERWPYILIDEYQDTNHAQYVLVKLLAAKNRNLCVVGDDWQSIYSWRGANFQNILDFEKDYPEAKVVKLEQNYRSTKAILDAAHRVIVQNENRSEKKLWTENEAGSKIVVYRALNESSEGRFVIEESERLVREEEVRLNQIAILYRTNAQSRAIEAELVRFNVPYRIVGGVRFYERREIKDVLAYLRLINSDQDWAAFSRIVNQPARGIGEVTKKKLIDYGRKNKFNISETLKHLEGIDISQKTRYSLEQFASDLTDYRKLLDKANLSEIVEMVLSKTAYLESLDDSDPSGDERIENVKELLSVTKEYSENNRKISLADFLEEIALVSDIDSYNSSEEALTLMTLHSAKGLEFEIIFIIGMEEGLFPHSNSLLTIEEMEEERRLCYVGITRAKKKVYLIYTERRLLYGNVRSNLPSRFLADLPEHLVEEVSLPGGGESQTLVEENFSAYFAVGEEIEHEDFGRGKIIEIDSDDIKIDFEVEGEKWLSLTYAKIKKIEQFD